jgi:hypothetical protein
VLDAGHAAIACTGCHAGNDPASDAEAAHAGMRKQPAHPVHLAQTCGTCHADQLAAAGNSLHFTLKNEVNTVRRAFGAEQDLASLVEIPQHEEIGGILDLADDLLRRRCLNCHLYSSGDQYPEARRGAGCAACHMEFAGGRAVSHAFIRSAPDSQCLHCHYGNFVGADFSGRFEHDFHWDFRTPYDKEGNSPRPYGVEYHELASDVHRRAGLACIDCHAGAELMGAPAAAVSCAACHRWQPGEPVPLPNLRAENGVLVLTGRLTGKTVKVPPLTHPAHARYKDKADCAVCHAQWSFTDAGTHLLRLDAEAFDPWAALYVQGSAEVEEQLLAALYRDKPYPYVFMSDKITGELYSGLWLLGYELRRWEFPIVCADEAGKLHICRPLLDLHLTYVNEQEAVVFDAIAPPRSPAKGLLPYTPHTIGRAGAFFSQRLRDNTELLTQPLNLEKTQQTPLRP